MRTVQYSVFSILKFWQIFVEKVLEKNKICFAESEKGGIATSYFFLFEKTHTCLYTQAVEKLKNLKILQVRIMALVCEHDRLQSGLFF